MFSLGKTSRDVQAFKQNESITYFSPFECYEAQFRLLFTAPSLKGQEKTLAVILTCFFLLLLRRRNKEDNKYPFCRCNRSALFDTINPKNIYKGNVQDLVLSYYIRCVLYQIRSERNSELSFTISTCQFNLLFPCVLDV